MPEILIKKEQTKIPPDPTRQMKKSPKQKKIRDAHTLNIGMLVLWILIMMRRKSKWMYA